MSELHENDSSEVSTKERSAVLPFSAKMEYLCLKNLGSMTAEDNQYPTSMEYYLKALAIDDTDLMLWFDLAEVAYREKKYVSVQLLELHLRQRFTKLPHNVDGG